MVYANRNIIQINLLRGDNRLICLVKMALLSDFFILRKKTGIKLKIRLEKNVFTHKKY